MKQGHKPLFCVLCIFWTFNVASWLYMVYRTFCRDDNNDDDDDDSGDNDDDLAEKDGDKKGSSGWVGGWRQQE